MMKAMHVVAFAVTLLLCSLAWAVRLPAAGPAERGRTRPSRQLPVPESLGERERAIEPEATADSVAELTLSDLEEMAMRNNPTLARARAAVRAAEGRWRQVGLYPKSLQSQGQQCHAKTPVPVTLDHPTIIS